MQFVRDLNLLLPAQSHHIAKSKLNEVLTDTDQLVSEVLKEKLFLEHVRMLFYQGTGLVKILPWLRIFIFKLPLFGQFQKNVVLYVFKLNLGNSSLDDSFPESVNVHLK